MTDVGAWERALSGPPQTSPPTSGYVPVSPASSRSRRHRGRHEQRSLRGDIQGLRFVAVMLVVLFHAGVKALPGGFIGVDVFFVISGFLITSNITRLLGEREFSLAGFYANRARRLLPAAFLTIAVTCLAAYLLLPPERFQSVAHDAFASAFYVVNWRMANQSVNYLAQTDGESPFQHFWSLAVEEQYYLVWPLLLIIAFFLTRSLLHRRRLGLALALALVLVPSFVYSVTYTASNASQAYFVTTTRMWELAIGGAAAMTAAAWKKLAPLAAAIAGWVGLAAILLAAVLYTNSTLFPGYAALLPTVGAATVIVAGPAAGKFGPVALLGRRIPVFIGNISYSLYLWHWPIIVFTATRFAHGLPVWAGLTAVAASFIPAYLSYRLVERRGMESSTFASARAGLGLGFMTSLSGAVAAMLLLAAVPEAHSTGIAFNASGVATNVQGTTIKIGAQVLGADPQTSAAGKVRNFYPSITPSPLNAKTNDVPDNSRCIASLTSSTDNRCFFGATSPTKVELVGDSHAMALMPAFDSAGVMHNWQVITHTKAACPFNTATIRFGNQPYSSCTSWNKAVMKALVAEHPKLVVITDYGLNFTTYSGGQPQSTKASRATLISGYETAWKKLIEAGIRVAIIAPTPIPGFDVPSCVTQNMKKLSACARPRSKTVQKNSALQSAARRTSGADYIDINDVICPGDTCPAVIGGVLVYRDDNHIGATYARSASGYVGSLIEPIVAK